MTLRITWPQALAWRMRRHLLDPVGRPSGIEVVERLCGVQAQVPSSAELAVRTRQEGPRDGELEEALAAGALIRTWAMRGTLHLIDPVQGPAFLALITAARPWARPSWQRAFGLSPEQVDGLRDGVRVALEGRSLTREELIEAVIAQPGLEDVADGLRSGWGTLLKPLAWQGELCHGPSQGNRVTFMRPTDVSPAWDGLPDPEEAAPRAIVAYLGAHGPATQESFGRWLAGGFFGTRQLRAWFDELGDRLVPVDVEDRSAVVLAEHADELAASEPTEALRLLPGFDQYVLAPGTADTSIVPAARRDLVSRQSGWISPVVVAGGVISGTWELERDRIRLTWFEEAGAVPQVLLEREVERLGAAIGRPLDLELSRA